LTILNPIVFEITDYYNKLKFNKFSKKKQHVSYFVIKFNYFLTTKNN